jgi:uncharacterized protein (TIGR03083 family)
MLLNPHYGADPALVLGGDPTAILVPTVRQRRRLAATIVGFTEAEWTHPTRCDEWSSRDVIVHLDGTNFFWTQSIAAGLRGDPTRFLATFDPVTSPARSVAQSQDLSSPEVRDRFVESTDTLVALLESLGPDDWTLLAEAPPGHVSISAVAHHALWDAWVHERDILLPLAADPIVEADEVISCLRYAAALGPILARCNGIDRRGRLALHATEPDADVLVEIGDHVLVTDEAADADLTLSGPAADLVDVLSIRRPMTQVIPADMAWMLEGLSKVFDHP